MRYAIIRNGVVESVVVWDGETPWTAPEGTEVVAVGDRVANPRSRYDGTSFTPPPPEPELDDA